LKELFLAAKAGEIVISMNLLSKLLDGIDRSE
jgi:hypothetical protein